MPTLLKIPSTSANGGFGRVASVGHPAGFRVNQPFQGRLSDENGFPLLVDQRLPVNFPTTVNHCANQQLTGARHVITKLDGYHARVRQIKLQVIDYARNA